MARQQKQKNETERRALHRIACGLHDAATVRPLTSNERAVFVMAQRGLTPELSAESILGYLGR